MRKLFFAAAAAAGLLYARLAGGPMDGTSWDVKVRPDSLFAFGRRGTLTFAQGRLTAEAPVGGENSSSVYNAQAMDGEPEPTVWNASSPDGEQGVVSWHGLARGDRIDGVALWWDRAGKLRRYTFSGRKKS